MLKRVLSFFITLTMMITSLFGVFPITEVKAATMADATFFSKLNYSAFPALSEVKQAADNGDYTTAKVKLLDYYKQRKATGKIKAFPVEDKDENTGMANLPLDNILTGPYEYDTQIGMLSIAGIGETNAQWYSADITKKVVAEVDNQAISVMLFERQKQDYPVIFYSRESAFSPVLDIETAEGDRYQIIPDNDTYIDSGSQTTVNASLQLLYSQEQSDSLTSAYGTKTKRTYINFPLTGVANKTVTKATLKLRAYVSQDCITGSKDVHIISIGDTTWSENTLTWAKTNGIGNIYSWQSDPSGPPWEAPTGADSEYLNVTARFWYARPMVWEYKKYLADPAGYSEGQQYGEKLLFLMNAFVTKKAYGFNRTLETGERLNRWIDVIDELVDTPAMTPDIFFNLMSFVWGDCNYLNSLDITKDTSWWSNWRIVANTGFFKGTEYFPEFLDYVNFKSKVRNNVEYTLDLLYNDDMSFTEAGPAYALWCVELFATCAKMGEQCGTPMSNTYITKLRYAARNALESFYPNGYDTNIGDSNYGDRMESYKEISSIINDDVLKAYVSGGKEGNPSYLTSYYPSVNTALMRNSWDPNQAVYLNFSNNPNDGHSHPDSSQLLMYAYGQPLLVDSGRYGYSGSDIYTKLITAQAHNTVEAVGLTLGAHSAAGHSFDYWASNKVFDFASTVQTGYSNIQHTRNVLFLKEGYAIVSDYIAGSSDTQEYRQNWHFLPSSNATMTGTTAKTAFHEKTNITIAAANAANSAILDGYHSANYGLVANSKYASYSQTGKNVKFDTLLYPTKAGENADIHVEELASGDLTHGAVHVTGEGIDAIYYVKNSGDTNGRLGSSGTTDAKMVYMNSDYSSVMMVGGTNIHNSLGEGVIQSNVEIPSISVRKNGSTLEIVGDNLMTAADESTAIKIRMDGVTSITLNGKEIELKKDSNGNIISIAVIQGDFMINGTAYNKVQNAVNLISNDDFTGESNGLTSWTNASNGSAFTAYTKATDPDYIHGIGNAITNTTSAGGSTATTLRRFVNVTPGKTYYLSYYAYNKSTATGSGWMSAAVLTGGGPVYGTFNNLTFYNHKTYGGMNSWSNENGPTYVGGKVTRVDDSYAQGMNHKQFLFDVPQGAQQLMLSYFAWTEVGSLYLSDFELYEVESVGGAPDTTATISFVTEEDTALCDSKTVSVSKGTIYAFENSPLSIVTQEGKLYKLDKMKSNLGTMIEEGANQLKAVYSLYNGSYVESKTDAARGATIQVSNGGKNHTDASSYINRIMADGRTSTSSGILYGLVGFTNPLSQNARVAAAGITVYTGATNDQTTSLSYSLYALESLGTSWTRDMVSGVGIPSGALPISTVTLSSALGAGVIEGVTFDISEYLADHPDSALNFLIISNQANYGVFHSENTSYKPELSIVQSTDGGDADFAFDGTTATVDGGIGEFVIMVAQYDGGGKLIQIDKTSSSALTVTKRSGAVKATAYLWKDIQSMLPLKTKITVDYQ